MTIPDYQTLMRPVLALHANGTERRSDEIRAAVISEFAVTEEERRRMLPSGRTPLLNNRVHWAVTYLAQAGALARTRRGYTLITDRGRDLLERYPSRIGKDALEEFPEFMSFQARSTGRSLRSPNESDASQPTGDDGGTAPRAADASVPTIGGATPDEVMDTAYRELRSALAEELLGRVKSQSPEFFENLVLDVLTAIGYGGSRNDAAERLGRTGDGGVDGVIREDALGLDVIYVQAKRWEGTVGRPVIQAFVGALHGAHAERGVLITTSRFSPDAIAYADGVAARVVLIDGSHLAELMIDYGVGVTATTQYELKRLDGDYFPDDEDSTAETADVAVGPERPVSPP